MEEIVLPKLGLTMEEGTIKQWLVEEGQKVEKGQFLFEVETDKVTVEVEAQTSGVLGKILVGEGETRPVGTPIAYLLEEGEALPAAVEAAPASPAREAAPSREAPPSREPSPAPPAGKVRATPAARRAAREAGIALEELRGTGPGGRIIEADVLDFLGARREEAPAAPAPEEAEVYRPSRIEQVMARRMAQSFAQAPHFYLTVEVDATRLVELRQGLLAPVEERAGVKLTYTDLLLKILAETLTDHPRLNAWWEEGQIRLHRVVNLGLAVAVEEGLIVPVLHGAAGLALPELARRRAELASRAAQGKLRLEDLEGATFTLSNLGMFEVDQFQAILNPPQAAILATGSIRERPGAVEGGVRLRPSLYTTLSVDHRVADGATAARFLQDLKARLEEPYRVLLP